MFFRIYQHLLPRAEAWKTTIAKRLRDLFMSLVEWPAAFRVFVDLILLDLFPTSTRALPEWARQFGLRLGENESDTRSALAGEWAAQGGQSRLYLENVLRAAGFDVRVFESFVRLDDFAVKPILWFRGDDPDAVVSEIHQGATSTLLYATMNDAGAVVTSGTIASVPNLGTLGGALVSAFGTGPEVETVGGRRYGRTTTTGGFVFGTASSLALLHAPTGNATVVLRLRFDSAAPASPGWLFTTRAGSANSRGVNIAQDTLGRLSFNVSDGTSNQVTATAVSAVSVGEHVVALRKTALFYELLLDGVVIASGTAASLTAGDSANVAQIGGRTGDVNPFAGALIHVGVWSSALSVEQIAGFGLVGEFYGNVPNLGTLGGALTPGSGVGPERVEIAGKWAARTTVAGSLVYGTTSSLTVLHEPASSALAIFRVRLDVAFPASNKRIFATRGSAASARGVIIFHTSAGTLQLAVSDGTSNVVSISGAVVAVGQHTIGLEKIGSVYTLYLNGSVYATGTAATLTSGSSADVAAFGSTSADTTNVDGALCEVAIFPGVFPAATRTALFNTFARWNGAGNGWVFRDPRAFTVVPLIGTTQCGDTLAQCGNPDAECSNFLANDPKYIVNKDLTGNAPPNIPADSARWPFFLYVSGSAIDTPFIVPSARRNELERLILKTRPLQHWVVLNGTFS